MFFYVLLKMEKTLIAVAQQIIRKKSLNTDEKVSSKGRMASPSLETI